VVATGEEKGLEQIDADYKLGIADPACPVKFVITQKALAEGWDCPFAYILVSMASLSFGDGGGATAWAGVAPTRRQPSAGEGFESVLCLRGVAQLCRDGGRIA
jgi:hypothetical protein